MLKKFTKNNRAIVFRKCICIKTMERNQTFNQDHWIRKDKGVSLSAAKKKTLTANSKSKFDSAAEHFIRGGMFINFKEIVDWYPQIIKKPQCHNRLTLMNISTWRIKWFTFQVYVHNDYWTQLDINNGDKSINMHKE